MTECSQTPPNFGKPLSTAFESTSIQIPAVTSALGVPG
jgi:hypothetical protein